MDEQIFIERVTAIKQKLHGVACAMLSHEQDREDALQEALLKAWANRRSLREMRYFDTWLIRILINECKNTYKKRARGRMPLPQAQAASEPPDSALRQTLGELDVKYRLPIVLHYIEGYNLEEIASMLRLPKGTVAWRLSQAKKLLKDRLGGMEG